MRLDVLGTYGPWPKAGGACSGYLLRPDDRPESRGILIDCGSGTLCEMLKIINVENISAVILSHLHFDHMSDMLVMRYALDFSRVGSLDVYLPGSPSNVYAMLSGGKFALHTIDGSSKIDIGGMTIDFLGTVHPVEGYSVRVGQAGRFFVYTSDTNIHERLPEFANGCDLLLADAGLSSDMWDEKKPHMSAKLCGELALKCKAKKLVLSHLSPQIDDKALLSEASQVYENAVLAARGMALTI